jgi:hypothetical protein
MSQLIKLIAGYSPTGCLKGSQLHGVGTGRRRALHRDRRPSIALVKVVVDCKREATGEISADDVPGRWQIEGAVARQRALDGERRLK